MKVCAPTPVETRQWTNHSGKTQIQNLKMRKAQLISKTLQTATSNRQTRAVIVTNR